MTTRRRAAVPAAALFLFSVLWMAGLSFAPRPGEPMAALFPLSFGPSAAMAGVLAAGAETVLGVGRIDTLLIVGSTDVNFAEKLRRSGAMLVIRAPNAGACRG